MQNSGSSLVHGFKNRYSERTGKVTDYWFFGQIGDVINNLINKKKKKNPIPNLTRISQTKAFLPRFLNQNQI